MTPSPYTDGIGIFSSFDPLEVDLNSPSALSPHSLIDFEEPDLWLDNLAILSPHMSLGISGFGANNGGVFITAGALNGLGPNFEAVKNALCN